MLFFTFHKTQQITFVVSEIYKKYLYTNVATLLSDYYIFVSFLLFWGENESKSNYLISLEAVLT